MSQRGFTFRVRETEVINPERVAQGLNVWADFLARRRLPVARSERGEEREPPE